MLMDHKVLHQAGTAQHWAVVQQSLQLVAVTVLMALLLAVMAALGVAGALVQDQAQQVKETMLGHRLTMCHPVAAVVQARREPQAILLGLMPTVFVSPVRTAEAEFTALMATYMRVVARQE